MKKGRIEMMLFKSDKRQILESINWCLHDWGEGIPYRKGTKTYTCTICKKECHYRGEYGNNTPAFDANFMVIVVNKMKEIGAVIEKIPTNPPFSNFTLTHSNNTDWHKFCEYIQKHTSCGKSLGWWVTMLTDPDMFFLDISRFLKYKETTKDRKEDHEDRD